MNTTATAKTTTKTTGPAVHYVSPRKLADIANARNPMAFMYLRGACGAKATARASLAYDDNADHVTCKRCLAGLGR